MHLKDQDKRHSISNYNYELPESAIAKYPLKERDKAKMLLYQKGDISEYTFRDIDQFLDKETTLFFNDTKVIPARLYFKKSTGAIIELFLLEPIIPTSHISEAMNVRGEIVYHCLVGNKKKWKEDQTLRIFSDEEDQLDLKAQWYDRSKDQVKLEWDNQLTFSEVLQKSGEIPLPPYLHRDTEPEDRIQYQTVYSKHEGAVAAPTAGLHFTDQVLEKIRQKGVKEEFLTLHVSAGTFQPIKEDDVTKHHMHKEEIIVTRQNIEVALQAKKIIPVGTTSMRTLESLYWYGIMLLENDNAPFYIEQDYPYRHLRNSSKEKALQAILKMMDKNGLDRIEGVTQIYIYPDYTMQMCNGLVTNFHLPKSSLLLLISALIGDDWKRVYRYALDNDFRFLSYGDGSLLLP